MHPFIILFKINPSILLDILCFHDYLPDTIMELLPFNTCIYIYIYIYIFFFLEHYFLSGILYITFTTCPCSSYIIKFKSIFFEGLNKWLMYGTERLHDIYRWMLQFSTFLFYTTLVFAAYVTDV